MRYIQLSRHTLSFSLLAFLAFIVGSVNAQVVGGTIAGDVVDPARKYCGGR